MATLLRNHRAPAGRYGSICLQMSPGHLGKSMVGERGFEPPAPASRRRISWPHKRATDIFLGERNTIKACTMRSFLARKVQIEPQPLSISNAAITATQGVGT